MQVNDSDLLAYLLHRLGETRMVSMHPRLKGKALELNKPDPELSRTFGNQDITAYVGFIDLANFSIMTSKKPPAEIAEFIVPFLEKSISILTSHGALIDKTIGDEVMFVLVERGEDPNAPEILFLGQICGALFELAHQQGSPYCFRIGISYGKVRATRINCEGYSEWSFFGEPIHVAKRLHELPELRVPNPVCFAFGMVIPNAVQVDWLPKLEAKLEIISCCDYKLVPKKELKGIGEVCCGVFTRERKL